MKVCYLIPVSLFLGLFDGLSAGDGVRLSHHEIDYRVYPRRTEEEAAVIEWGNSAIISALDASVAHFGPQTSQSALLEVETMPVIAVPVNGVRDIESAGNSTLEGETTETNIRPLDNADEIRGNVVVMTNTGGLSGVEMAKIAQMSGAAALLVVNVDEQRPDDIYRLPAEPGSEVIDIPVVMISLNSANVLTTATVTPEMAPSDIVNNGMPERIRLYSGGDRPFFEDVESSEPTVYIIHNLLTVDECKSLLKQAAPRLTAVTRDDVLQLTQQSEKLVNVRRVMLWQGMIKTPARKQIEERIEQVTGFPAKHYSDFIIDRLDVGSQHMPHYDALPVTPSGTPMATITVFLNDAVGGEVVYPSAREKAVKIVPKVGMAVVHHNMDEEQQFDVNAIHGILPVTQGNLYIARKFIFASPVSNARRIAIPVFAAPFGGKLPLFFSSLHDFLADQFGSYESGGRAFDKLCIFVPVLLALWILQIIASAIQKHLVKGANNFVKAKNE